MRSQWLVGGQDSFDLNPGPEPSSRFIAQVLAVDIAWAFALEAGGMPVTAKSWGLPSCGLLSWQAS